MPISSKEAIPLNTMKTESSKNRFSGKHLSQGIPITNTSFDVYYRESSAGIPFQWESQPGTPKIRSRESPLHPLTPPPSFHCSPISVKPKKEKPKNNLSNIKNHPPTSLSSIFPWSRSSSSVRTPNEAEQCGILSPPRRSLDSMTEEGDDFESPVPSSCFRARRGKEGKPERGSASIIKLLCS